MMSSLSNQLLPGQTLKLAFLLASLLAAAAPSAWAQCDLGTVVTTPITFAGTYRMPVVTGTVNNKPFRFTLHSSESVSTLNRDAAEKLGLNVQSHATNYAGIDVLTAFTDKVTVGAVARNGEFIVIDKKNEAYDGKVGATMLLRNDLELAFADGYMKQNSPSGCIQTFLASWDPKATVVTFTADPQRSDLRPWFWVTVNGTRVRATIATDYSYSMIDSHTAARMGLTHEMPGAEEDGEAKGWYDKVHKVSKVPATVTIGNGPAMKSTLRIFDMDLSGEVMVLGADFLRANRVLISMSQRKIYITQLKDVMFAE
jgi:hypothetical protein